MGHAHDWIGRGHELDEQGRLAEALEAYRRALDAARAANDAPAEALALSSLGAAHAQAGQYADALARYDEAIAIWRALGDRRSALYTLMNRAFLHFGMENGPAFEADAAEARALAEELGEIDPQVRLLWLHGDRAFAAGALEKGFRLYGEAARLAVPTGGELLWPTGGYLDEHLDRLVATGQRADAAIFCDYLATLGERAGLGNAFVGHFRDRAEALRSIPLLGAPM
jgi:tetratricopeptide (TPR) repeat protein